MPDLKVNIAGVEFKNPIIVASGFYGYSQEYQRFYPLSRLGGVTLNGTTFGAKEGSPTPRIAEAPSGVLSNTGMPNPGVLAAGTALDFSKIAGAVLDSCVDMIEANLAAANMENGGIPFGADAKSIESAVKNIRLICKKKLIVKLPPNLTQVAELAKAVEGAGADALSLIGTVFGMRIDVKTRRPIGSGHFSPCFTNGLASG